MPLHANRAAHRILLGLMVASGCTGPIDGASESTPAPAGAPPMGEAPRPGAGQPASPGAPGPGPGPAAGCPASSDPGTVVMRRLTHAEYDNSVRDLLGDTSMPGRRFPAEGSAKTGF